MEMIGPRITSADETLPVQSQNHLDYARTPPSIEKEVIMTTKM
jgi:hypothetical protein